MARGTPHLPAGSKLVFLENEQAKARQFLRSLPEQALTRLLGRAMPDRGVGHFPLINTLIVRLCTRQLIVYDVGGGTGVDNAAVQQLRRDIKLQLAQILQQERQEAAAIEAEYQQRNTLGKVAAYGEKFGVGLGESAWSMLTWAKDVYDVVSIQERLTRMARSAWAAYDDDPGQWVRQFGEEMIAREHREAVELLGFDPLKISPEMLAEAYEVANLIWEDEPTQQLLVDFVRDYAAAQHSLEWTQIAGGAAFEIILTAVLAAFTGGIGAVASLGSKARLLRPLSKLGNLFRDLAKLLKKARRPKRRKKPRQSSSKIEEFQSEGKVPEASEPPKGPEQNTATKGKVNSAGQPINEKGQFVSEAGGESAATARGRAAHEAFDAKVQAKSDQGWVSKPRIVDSDGRVHIPDALTPSGRPIEYKPNTPSGIKEGRRQLKRYERVTGKKGRLLTYDVN
ncbi:hypothetical protein [Exilibacterium tricleocarpae]|uniref:hypothetical protein n=1 Tax=Exilibacterium tricleocarpae TaxID=2591008 RepID=UPI0015D2BE19|nr:hypothetical protein [Exilibacterium tricleocarpae]